MIFFRTIGIVYSLCVVVTDGYNFRLNHGTSLLSNQMFYKKRWNPYGNKYRESLNKIKQKDQHKYPISKPYFEEQLKRLNSKNNTSRDDNILGLEEPYNFTTVQLIFNQDLFNALGLKVMDNEYEMGDDEHDNRYNSNNNKNNNNNNKNNKETKSENFEVIRDYKIKVCGFVKKLQKV